MRVLHVSHQYPPAIGGAERYIADLSEELVTRGHQVDVFTSRATDFHTWQNTLTGFEQRQGVNIFRFRSLRRRGYVWALLHYGLSRYQAARARRYEPFIFVGGGPLSPGLLAAMLSRGRQYDLIHLNCLVYAHVAYGYWAARRLQVPVIVTPHAHVEQEATYNIGYQRTVLAGSDHILADTPAEREFLMTLGLPANRVTLGGVGLRAERYPIGDRHAARAQLGLPPDEPVALFLGRKDMYKGPELAVQAVAQLQQRYPRLHLLAVGPETDASQAMWPRYAGLRNLHLRGAVSDEEKLLALQACDFLALPSIGEAFGIVFLEAWAVGKPVIGARTLAVSAVIDEYRDGLLAAPDDAYDLAQRMAYLLDRPERAQAMGERGRQKVLNNYTLERITDRVEEVYRQVVEGRSGVINTKSQWSGGLSAAAPASADFEAAQPAPAAIGLALEQEVIMPATKVIEIHDPEVDMAQVRHQLAARLQQQSAAGGYGPPVQELGPAALRRSPRSPARRTAATAQLDQLLIRLNTTGQLHAPAFQSGAPVIGRVIVAIRRAWNWMSTKWYVQPIMTQQTEHNQLVTLSLSELAQWQELYEQRLAEVQQRLVELEQRLASTGQQD